MIGERLLYNTGDAFPGVGLADEDVNQIGAGPVRLFQIGGYSPPATNTDYFVFLFDSAGPVAGDTGFQQFAVPAGGSFSWDPSLDGVKVPTGLWYAISTTPGIYTAAASGATLFLYAQYVNLSP